MVVAVALGRMNFCSEAGVPCAKSAGTFASPNGRPREDSGLVIVGEADLVSVLS